MDSEVLSDDRHAERSGPAIPGLADRFPPGTAVRHANPALADWEGTVTPTPGGKFVCGDEVHVTWSPGGDGDTGWYAAKSLRRADYVHEES